MNEKTVTIIIRNIPRELKDRFKAACALKGKTMNDVIISLMEREVENQK